MTKVYMMCGKICSGKSTYAAKLRQMHRAAVLSVDEITLALFGQNAGEQHDTYVERAEAYLYRKSLELTEAGISVILDWGFWTKAERRYAREFYAAHQVECELHYLEISPEEWQRRIAKRNADILAHRTDAYYVDAGLAAKFEAIFEPPEADEISVRVGQQY